MRSGTRVPLSRVGGAFHFHSSTYFSHLNISSSFAYHWYTRQTTLFQIDAYGALACSEHHNRLCSLRQRKRSCEIGLYLYRPNETKLPTSCATFGKQKLTFTRPAFILPKRKNNWMPCILRNQLVSSNNQ